jgi:guanylate kinase
MRPGLVLYGPPASGKDTITAELGRIDPRCQLFRKLKVGGGRGDAYRMIERDAFLALVRRGEILYHNERYGNVYAVDLPELRALRTNGVIPIVHMGQLAGVTAMLDHQADWLFARLCCRRETTALRAHGRGSIDVAARLQVWDEMAAELANAGSLPPHLTIDTDAHPPAAAARALYAAMMSP